MGAMKINDFIDQALMIPYVMGGSEMSGADCWGIVELYYKHVLDIELDNRGDIEAGHMGIQEGFDQATNWKPIDQPENHCLVALRAGRIKVGHIGVYVDGNVLHSADEETGCVFQPISDRFIKTRITAFLRYQ
jgi:cell wall-associated NlpC family hydrolase